MNDVAGIPGGKTDSTSYVGYKRRGNYYADALQGKHPAGPLWIMDRWVSKQNMIYGLWGQEDWILAKFFFLRFDTSSINMQKKRGQCPSILTEQACLIKELQYYLFTVHNKKEWKLMVLFLIRHVCVFTAGMTGFSHSTLAIPKTTLVLSDLLFNPLTSVTSIGLCSTSDVITFNQNWHHLYSSFAGLEEKHFPVIPRSEWMGQWCLRYARKCTEVWVKNSQQNFPRLHFATPW